MPDISPVFQQYLALLQADEADQRAEVGARLAVAQQALETLARAVLDDHALRLAAEGPVRVSAALTVSLSVAEALAAVDAAVASLAQGHRPAPAPSLPPSSPRTVAVPVVSSLEAVVAPSARPEPPTPVDIHAPVEAPARAEAIAAPPQVETLVHDPLNAQVQRLRGEVDRVDWDAASDAWCVAKLSAAVAEARTIQDEVARTGQRLYALDGLFTRLLDISKTRRPGFVHGLARNHAGDWPALHRQALAKLADLDRPRPVATPPGPRGKGLVTSPLTRRLVIPQALLAQVQARETTTPAADDTDDEADDEADDEDAGPDEGVQALTSAATLRAWLNGRSLVVFGGAVDPAKRTMWTRLVGREVEWMASTSKGFRERQNLERRMQRGRIGALVLLEGLIGHTHDRPLVDLARLSNTLVAYGGKAGVGTMRQAFESLAQQVGQRR